MSSKKNPKHYVNNKEFFKNIVEYKKLLRYAKENGLEPPRIPEYAGECIRLIAVNMAKYYKFSRYTYKDEMIGDAILNCIKYFDNFDETKYNNPHTYFTQICYNSNVQRIKIEKKNMYIRYKSFENEMVLPSDRSSFFDEKHGVIQESMYDNISDYIDTWEKSEEKKKQERKLKMAQKKKDGLSKFYEE